MRIKLSFSRDGVTVQDQDEVKNLPPALWQWIECLQVDFSLFQNESIASDYLRHLTIRTTNYVPAA